MKKIVMYMKDRFNNTPTVITENDLLRTKFGILQ
nr:PREDICTED: uncharacterized protein LOC104226949 isoform X2 [Nicotiana sylvestris]XP_009777365.1 PREDICTED: uncharacterized protein LOC104226949 isoform X2 [Nicotiana sylvestris]